jgi:hypothetical protein
VAHGFTGVAFVERELMKSLSGLSMSMKRIGTTQK